MPKAGPLQRISSRDVHESPLVSIREDQVRTDSGPCTPYTVIQFKVCGVCVLPIDADGNTRLVGQHRYVADRFTWELVRGGGDLCNPFGAAQRELKEETGITARKWLQVLDLMASPGLSDEQAPGFIAWETQEGRTHPDESEEVRLRKLHFREVVDLVLSGQIVDAPSCALVLTTYVRAQRGELPGDLIELLGVEARRDAHPIAKR